MNRRTLVRSAAAALPLAGCIGERGATTDTQTPELPTVSWNEERVEGEQFALTATVVLNDYNRVEFKINEETVAATDESAKVQIAGPDTEYGTIEIRTNVWAHIEGQSVALSKHTVGRDS
jgi:hypothetical protein